MTHTASASPTRIGWIGTGIMGAAMCGHLQAGGHTITVFNRSKGKAQPLLDKGAAWAETPAAAAAASDVVFSIVGFPKDVREVYFGENGILAGAKPGTIIVDMTTNSPTLAQEIEAAAKKQGLVSLDAPVTGGDVGARNAALSIMVGGDEATFEAIRPLLALMGKTIVRQGGPGAGQHAKMCNQIVIAGHMIGVCESLLYGVQAGLDPNRVLESISTGAAACPALTVLAPRVLKGDFAPGFYIEHFIKDMGIVLEESKKMGIELKGLALVESLYQKAREMGYGQNGTQALYLTLRKLAGLKD